MACRCMSAVGLCYDDNDNDDNNDDGIEFHVCKSVHHHTIQIIQPTEILIKKSNYFVNCKL